MPGGLAAAGQSALLRLGARLVCARVAAARSATRTRTAGRAGPARTDCGAAANGRQRRRRVARAAAEVCLEAGPFDAAGITAAEAALARAGLPAGSWERQPAAPPSTHSGCVCRAQQNCRPACRRCSPLSGLARRGRAPAPAGPQQRQRGQHHPANPRCRNEAAAAALPPLSSASLQCCRRVARRRDPAAATTADRRRACRRRTGRRAVALQLVDAGPGAWHGYRRRAVGPLSPPLVGNGRAVACNCATCAGAAPVRRNIRPTGRPPAAKRSSCRRDVETVGPAVASGPRSAAVGGGDDGVPAGVAGADVDAVAAGCGEGDLGPRSEKPTLVPTWRSASTAITPWQLAGVPTGRRRCCRPRPRPPRRPP